MRRGRRFYDGPGASYLYHTNERGLKTMTNKTYDIIKNVALFAVPVLAFVASLCTIWNVPYCEQITATLTALDTLLGAVVIVAKKIYDGSKQKEG